MNKNSELIGALLEQLPGYVDGDGYHNYKAACDELYAIFITVNLPVVAPYVELLAEEWAATYQDHESGFMDWLRVEFYEGICELQCELIYAWVANFNETIPVDSNDDYKAAGRDWFNISRGV